MIFRSKTINFDENNVKNGQSEDTKVSGKLLRSDLATGDTSGKFGSHNEISVKT